MAPTRKRIAVAYALATLVFSVKFTLTLILTISWEDYEDHALSHGPPLGNAAIHNVSGSRNDLLSPNIDTPHDQSFVVDILVTGSETRKEYMEAQRRTWASHVSVRHFWTATEQNDHDPSCVNMTTRQSFKVSMSCRKRPKQNSAIGEHFRTSFASPLVLHGKKNPTGWLCAQSRMTYNLAERIKQYSGVTDLPDYLLIIDDDSYVNLEWFQKAMQDVDSSVPMVSAGCRVRHSNTNWTFPYGGYGTFVNRGAVKRMLQPLYCNSTAVGFELDACQQLHQNLLLELNWWRPGRCINDIIHDVATLKPFCFHSDWIVAYFANYYGISKPSTDMPESGLHALNKSDNFNFETVRGHCRHHGASAEMKDGDVLCNKDSNICHYVTPFEIREVSKHAMASWPEKYSSVS